MVLFCIIIKAKCKEKPGVRKRYKQIITSWNRHIVGTVFQDPRSQFTTTTDEEIAFGLQTICKSRDGTNRVEEVYAELDIDELKGKSAFWIIALSETKDSYCKAPW